MIYFTSDTHYFHKNIAGPNTSMWKSGYRDFEDEKEMSKHIVKVFNKTVNEDDTLYHLGDWSFAGIQNIWNFRKQLKCKNIHLILGNHDEHIRKNKILPNVEGWGDEITKHTQDVFTSVQDVLTVKHNKHEFFLSHYSHKIWNGSYRGTIHLYGHSHGTIEDFGKSMDVGIDNAKKILGEYRPFSIEEIISIMNEKDIKLIDHHIDNNKQ